MPVEIPTDSWKGKTSVVYRAQCVMQNVVVEAFENENIRYYIYVEVVFMDSKSIEISI